MAVRNGHDFKKTPKASKSCPFPSPPTPPPHAGEGSFEKSLRDFDVNDGLP
jgi:hypothetical protein